MVEMGSEEEKNVEEEEGNVGDVVAEVEENTEEVEGDVRDLFAEVERR